LARGFDTFNIFFFGEGLDTGGSKSGEVSTSLLSFTFLEST
jgi:hypothetical protein